MEASWFSIYKIKCGGEVAQLCPTLCDPVDCSLPGSSFQGILQARILEWVVISFSRGSSQPRNWTWVSCIAGKHFNLWATLVNGNNSPFFLIYMPFISSSCLNTLRRTVKCWIEVVRVSRHPCFIPVLRRKTFNLPLLIMTLPCHVWPILRWSNVLLFLACLWCLLWKVKLCQTKFW